ncbi:CRISPR system precrRNA processing endoribonuclease RAMP protein Cas6 [Nitrospira sp. Kam-Ns4a]
MLTSFSLASFKFVLQPEDRLALHPRNPGNTLRGAFGATFKRLVCPTPSDCRERCQLHPTCPYGQIFKPGPPPGADRLRLNQDLPRPFILRPPSSQAATAAPGDSLHFGLILIGNTIAYFPYFLVTFRELGRQGIGLGRGRYDIKQVLGLPSPLQGEDQGEEVPIYSATDQLVRPPAYRVTYDDCRRLVTEWFARSDQRGVNSPRPAGGSAPPGTDHGQRITLRFLTPTHLKANGTLVTRPDFHHLIKRLRDRINALAYFYCGDTLDVDHKGFGERAEQVRTVRCNVHWEDRDRRSWKTGLAHDMGGFVGDATYEGALGEFLPLLILGQYTHVGKYAVWGHGQYEVVTPR